MPFQYVLANTTVERDDRQRRRPQTFDPAGPEAAEVDRPRPCVAAADSRNRIDVTRKPEIVKNTETPMNPPGNRPGSPEVAPAWNSTTSVTAIARSPSSDGW